jgi:hypothetical protein
LCYHQCGCENITHALDQCLLAASILTSAIISDVREPGDIQVP